MVGIDPKVYIDQYRSLQTLKLGYPLLKAWSTWSVRAHGWNQHVTFRWQWRFLSHFFMGSVLGIKNWMEIPIDILEGLQGDPWGCGLIPWVGSFWWPLQQKAAGFFLWFSEGANKMMHCFFSIPSRPWVGIVTTPRIAPFWAKQTPWGMQWGWKILFESFYCFEIPKTKDLDPSFLWDLGPFFVNIWNAKKKAPHPNKKVRFTPLALHNNGLFRSFR